MSTIKKKFSRENAVKCPDHGDGLETMELMENRIKQQSELISLMKTRNDGMILQLANYEKIVKELEESKKQSEDSLIGLQHDYKTLSERFNILSHNHDELIKIKDEYKDKLKNFRLQNESLLCANDETVALKDQLQEEREALAEARAENSVLLRRLRQTEDTLTDKTSSVELATLEIASLKRQLSEKDIQLTDSHESTMEMKRCLNVCREDCACLKKQKEEIKVKLKTTESLLDAEKDSSKFLTRKMLQLEEELNKIRSHSLMLSKDSTVQLLRNEVKSIKEKLERTQQEFIAYQEFSSKQLKEEKALNEKLRHLAL